MEKRYQVFVSSTYADLQEERRNVIQTLMEMDCIPAGMEMFPAVDEEQWEFIKKVIKDCDYYILIIGGRYGSLTSEGISYTEKEYDFAVSLGLKVIAFLHKSPDEIPVKNSELDSKIRVKLETFRNKVSQGRLVKFWHTADELPGLVSMSLSKTIKTYPAIGWVRANQIANMDILSEVNELRKQKEELESQISTLKLRDSSTKLAGLNDMFTISILNSNKKCTLSWGELFGMAAPTLLEDCIEDVIYQAIEYRLPKVLGENSNRVFMEIEIRETIKIQFIALGLIEYEKHKNGGVTVWHLTAKGKEAMIQVRAQKV